eukprot:COSAG02_NODE_36246_length_456_cov_0.815642_1_plen_75_part_10
MISPRGTSYSCTGTWTGFLADPPNSNTAPHFNPRAQRSRQLGSVGRDYSCVARSVPVRVYRVLTNAATFCTEIPQ